MLSGKNYAALIAAALACVATICDLASSADAAAPDIVRQFVRTHCLDCHGDEDPSAELNLLHAGQDDIAEDTALWESVVGKLEARTMPPSDASRPGEDEYVAAAKALTGVLDGIARQKPFAGRTPTLRRLTRVEYQNAIRDLLALQVDATRLLPKDESSHGFDNITVGELSPTLLNRYLSAARKISRLAVGRAGAPPVADTIRIRPDITQESHVPGLPIGTRGGALISHQFPQAGTYEISVRLARDRNEHVEGLRGVHQLEVLLDRKRMASFTVRPPGKGSKDHSKVDAHLQAKIEVAAGPHQLGVTFARRSSSLLETMRQPYQAHFNMHRHPRISPAIFQISITGPLEKNPSSKELASDASVDTPSRRRIFTSRPRTTAEEVSTARTVLAPLARQAWRRPVKAKELDGLLDFYREGAEEGGFEAGVESALAAILVNPKFLFRIELDPPDANSGAAYALSDLELASRLSFFLWSSIPDVELLELAEENRLRDPKVLTEQVERMLADPRSRSLVTNFAGQWLYLRNLDTVHPDMRLFPDFDHNLRDAMRTETELFFESIVRENRSALDLLRADYTYLNERLAKHYRIPHIQGSRFRRVALDENSRRGGLLRHGSILTVTSYATRTSPVIRGHWILANLVGSPPPPPPDDVPALKDNTVAANLSVRERLAQHRADPNCSSCHNLMDPVGFALENFDAIGRWRDLEAGRRVDASGGFPDGSEFRGVEGLEEALLKRPELFVGTMTRKLMTYATGRILDHRDAPAIRQVVRDAKTDRYRFASLVAGIVKSPAFQMRTAE